MEIGFYIEYPNTENLQKLQMIDFPINVYLAMPSLLEFQEKREMIGEIDEKGVIKEFWYWPVLTQKEGYTISPFASEEGLKRVLQEINECNDSLNVLIDAELPIGNFKRIINGLGGFRKKKQLLYNLFEMCRDKEINVLTAEYPPIYKQLERLEEVVGLTYSPEVFGNTRTWMCYSSIGKYFGATGEKVLSKGFEKLWLDLPKDVVISLGCMGKGQLKSEPIITPKKLEHELKLLVETNTPELIFYRLGGLDSDYLAVIKNILELE